ncbi:MAG TPA: LPS export ABC transporter periplasmic protein LptC [Gammaproteobacteria bacterium]|nr:LPS export ABC transporter periplasmic protein LptC [Gammaproteobacteria bacterium]
MWRKLTFPLLVAAVAWLSAEWLWKQEAETPAVAPLAGIEAPDAFMEGVVMRVMDGQGRPRYEMRAARAVHFASGDRTDFDAPFLSFFRPDGKLWTLAAERGMARDGDRDILLSGEVLMRRPQDPARPMGAAEVEVFTRDLRILGEREYAETDQPTTIVHAYGRVEAVGMKAWFKQERLQLLSQVHGIYATTH